MDAVVVLVIFAGAVAALLKYNRYEAQRRLEAAHGSMQGQLQHRRSGDYPSSCSWCKNTALARRLFVFERVQGSWHACDLQGQLRTCPDTQVGELADALLTEHPRWRRFCTERCVNEFLKGERVQTGETFVGCDYCSVRFPLALVRCPNCGAASTNAQVAHL